MAFSRGLRNHAVPLLVTSESRDPPQIQRDKIEPPLADGPWLDDTGREQEGRERLVWPSLENTVCRLPFVTFKS